MSFVGCEVFRNNFWMLHHGSKSPKRTTVWSVRRFLVSGLAHISAQNAPGIMNVHMNCMYTIPQLEQPRTKGRWRKLPKRKRPPSRPRVLFPASCILLWGLDSRSTQHQPHMCSWWLLREIQEAGWFLWLFWLKRVEGYSVRYSVYTCFQLSQMSIALQLECVLALRGSWTS